MILRQDHVFTAVTNAGEAIHINCFKRMRHDYDVEAGFYEVEERSRLLVDEHGRTVNFIEKGNYRIIDGKNLIEVVSTDPSAY